MFESSISDLEPVIDDSTDVQSLILDGVGRGLNLGLRGPKDYEYGEVAQPFPEGLYVPSSEWKLRIQKQEEEKSRTSDLIRLYNLPPLNQESTNYCWANAPVHASEIVRLQQNQSIVRLSPASVAAQIKGYRNVGGWGQEALQWIVDHGIVPTDLWPANAIDKKYATQEAKDAAQHYRVDQWIELQPKNLDQLVSCLLNNIPVAVGYNFWGHEVVAVDAVWVNGAIGVRFRNSWGMWGDFGFGILTGAKMYPDDACAPLTTLAM